MTYGKKVSPSRKTRIATIKLMQELGSDQSHHYLALEPKLVETLGIDYRRLSSTSRRRVARSTRPTARWCIWIFVTSARS